MRAHTHTHDAQIDTDMHRHKVDSSDGRAATGTTFVLAGAYHHRT